MSIGSAPEIGSHFRRWGDMTPEQRQAWFDWLSTAPPVGTLVERRFWLEPVDTTPGVIDPETLFATEARRER